MSTRPYVLVVDDEAGIADLIVEALEDEGYVAQTVHDGASALLAIARQRPALVLLDIAMPVVPGDEVLDWLRRHNYGDLPVVVMTAGLQPQRFRELGASDVMPKPFSLETLLDTVERNIGRAHARDGSV